MGVFRNRGRKAPDPEMSGKALVGALIFSVVAIDLTRTGVRWVGSKVRDMFSKPALEVTFEPEAATDSQPTAPKVDGNVAQV